MSGWIQAAMQQNTIFWLGIMSNFKTTIFKFFCEEQSNIDNPTNLKVHNITDFNVYRPYSKSL